MQGFDPSALRQAYFETQEGEPRMRAIRSAITQAEQAKDDYARLIFHRDFIKESVFSGDRYQALIDFPQYLAIYDANPELHPQFRYHVLWTFKWILQAAAEFPQIEKSQVLRWFSHFRSELSKAGYSLKPFYNLRAAFYSYYDYAKFLLDYEDFQNAKADEMSDGDPDTYDAIVQYELLRGNDEAALKTANLIFERNYRTDEVPAKTYSYLLRYAMLRHDMETAAHYAELLRPFCIRKRFRMTELGLLLCFDAKTNPCAAYQLLSEHEEMRRSSRNPYLCFWFDRGAMMVYDALANRQISVPLDNGQIFTPEDAARLAEETRTRCLETAALFDARNGSDYFTAALDELSR